MSFTVVFTVPSPVQSIPNVIRANGQARPLIVLISRLMQRNACMVLDLPHRCGNSRAIWDHTVLPSCHPTKVTFLPLPQPKLVLFLRDI